MRLCESRQVSPDSTVPVFRLFVFELGSWNQLPPALVVFRRFLTQFVINLHEILQALFATIPAPTQKNFMKFASVFQKLDHFTRSRILRLKLNEINGVFFLEIFRKVTVGLENNACQIS